MTIGLDTWGNPISNNHFFVTNDFKLLKALMLLIDAGYAYQITLGRDFSSRIMDGSYDSYGCTCFLELDPSGIMRRYSTLPYP